MCFLRVHLDVLVQSTRAQASIKKNAAERTVTRGEGLEGRPSMLPPVLQSHRFGHTVGWAHPEAYSIRAWLRVLICWFVLSKAAARGIAPIFCQPIRSTGATAPSVTTVEYRFATPAIRSTTCAQKCPLRGAGGASGHSLLVFVVAILQGGAFSGALQAVTMRSVRRGCQVCSVVVVD